VRNTLGVVRSLVRRTARGSTTIEDYAMRLEGRIEAFARVQSSATRDPARGINLEYLTAEELRAAGGREGDTFTVEGPQVLVSAKSAETLGLAIHELADNAMTHGALAAPRGEIRVRWVLAEGGGGQMLELNWQERGMSRLPPQPPRRGFGTELLSRTLAYELKAEVSLDFLPTGLQCRINVPLAQMHARDGVARLD
jgi:two-component sensor histidine kinase